MPDTPDELEEFLGVGEVARRLGWTKRKVQRVLDTKEIPIVGRFGVQHQLVFREEDVEHYIEEHNRHQ